MCLDCVHWIKVIGDFILLVISGAGAAVTVFMVQKIKLYLDYIQWVKIIGEFIFSVISGLVPAFFIYVIQQIRYYLKLKRKFHNKYFIINYKNGEPYGEARCIVSQNVISYTGKAEGPASDFQGEFLMNEINLTIGEGFHAHEGYNGFNFPKIMIKDDETFLVETSYIEILKELKRYADGSEDENGKFNIYGIPHPQAFIWKKQHLK